MRKTLLQIVLLSAANFCFGVVDAAEQNAASGVIYRCRTQTGGTAFVSKLDATLKDCVRVSDSAANPSPAISPDDQRKPHVETAEEHDARLKRVMTQVTQWCIEKAGKKPKSRELDACVQDKFGTYTLLYP